MSGHEIVERALALSKADGCVVLVQESSTANLRWANNTLTTNGAGRDRSVAVISVMGESVGVRSATVIDDLEGLVRASEQAAREAGPAEDAGPLVTGDAAADFTEPAETCSTAIFADLARELGTSFGAARSDGRRLFGYASHDVTTTWLGSSTGLRVRHAEPTGYVEVTGKNHLPGGSSRRIDLPAGRYETLVPPSAVADLMIYLYWTAAARDAAEGRTVFSKPGGGTRVGESLGPAGLRLSSDPRDPALHTTPYVVTTSSSSMTSVFDNGLPLAATDWIRDGVLSALVQTRASATLTGLPVTPYVHNLSLDGGGTATTDEMVASTERGLLLTCLWYIREVDPETLLLTGLTRDGVYLVEGGEVVGVVNNFRFNESPVDLLGRLAQIGRSEPALPREWSDDFTWTRMPTLRIGDFNMSSVSQAS
jgi:predicted Zn-dependent protease